MFLTLIVFSIWFSYFDLRYHRITNRSLGILFVGLSVALLVENSEFHVVSSVLVSLISVVGYKYGLGAGDVKLATVLSLYFLPVSHSAFSEAITGFLVISSISILLHLIFGRKLTDSIALAPAICGAFIWCAR